MLFCRYANHICVSHTARTNYVDEYNLPPIIRTPSIFGKAFLLVRNVYDRHFVMIMHMHVYKEDELLKPLNPMKVITKRNLKSIRIENCIL
jgi:hypothetical protein